MKKSEALTVVDYIQVCLDDDATPDIGFVHQLGIPIDTTEFDGAVKAVAEDRARKQSLTQAWLGGSIGGLSRVKPNVPADPFTRARWAIDVDDQIKAGRSPKMSNDMHVHASTVIKEAWMGIAHQRHAVWSPGRDINSYGRLIATLVRGLVPG